MPKFARISAEFIRNNKFFMGKLTPQQQKIWFTPFLAIAEKYDPDDIEHGEVLTLSLEELRKFLNSKQSNKELKRTLTKAFSLFKELYFRKEGRTTMPFVLEKVEQGHAYFRLRDVFVISSFHRGKQYFLFNLDEIAAYKNGHSQKSRTIPLLWYCMAHRHWSQKHKCWEVEFGDRELKMALGLNRCDYLYIPDHKREYYVDVDKHIATQNDWSYVESLFEKYNIQSKSLRDLEKPYYEIQETVFFKRWDFEQKVLLPAISELNRGTMINFRLQDVLKRSEHKYEKATWVKSYIGKNYTKYESGRCVILPNGGVIDRNITDFTKLQGGRQYRFLIEKQPEEKIKKYQ